jgi:hypothetical protein
MITSYSTLQDEVSDWLNRSDLSSASSQRTSLGLSDGVVTTFIQMAEGKLKRDHRVRKLQARTITVTAEEYTLPSDFDSLQSLAHDGQVYFGSIEIVGPEKLSEIKGKYGTSGVPSHASLIDGVLRFAPVTSSSISLKMTYWVVLPALSESAPTNWLLEDHPDIYLYATLLESAPYLKDDPRVAIWKSELNERLEELHLSIERAQFSGRMVARPRRAIG